MNNKSLLVTFFLLVFSILTYSQTGQPPVKGSLTRGTIDSQFVYLNNVSNSWEDFKVIRRTNLDLIRKNVADSLSQLRARIQEVSSSVAEQQNQISTLKDSLSFMQQELQIATDNQDSVSMLGLSLRRSTYGVLFIAVVSLLVILLIIYIYRFNRSNIDTRDAKKAYEDLHTEFDQHRKRAMEKEQKLMRQLQDEINRRLS